MIHEELVSRLTSIIIKRYHCDESAIIYDTAGLERLSKIYEVYIYLTDGKFSKDLRTGVIFDTVLKTGNVKLCIATRYFSITDKNLYENMCVADQVNFTTVGDRIEAEFLVRNMFSIIT